jgi:multidrug resistance efflux pump
MRKFVTIALALGIMTAAGARLALHGAPEAADPGRHRAPVYTPGWVAANGVVEGARPETALRPEVVGTVAAIKFRENEAVAAGAVMAELHNATQKHHVALARAEVHIARAELKRLRNGERREKRSSLAAAERAQEVVYRQAAAEYKRARRLGGSRSISQEELDNSYFKMLRAEAELKRLRAEHALVEAAARSDEVEAAEARVAAAEARLRLAEAELAKTCLRAPYAGRVLQVYAEPGELAGPTSAQPILLLADLSRRRVRAFVEELDAPRVRVGQQATVTVDSLPGKQFTGTVRLVLPRMGKRSLQTDAPGEYKDLYFREVLIDLKAGDELPINMRVQTRIRAK